MAAYVQLIGSYINNFLSQLEYVGEHLGSYPGIILIVSLILILGSLGLLNKLMNL